MTAHGHLPTEQEDAKYEARKQIIRIKYSKLNFKKIFVSCEKSLSAHWRSHIPLQTHIKKFLCWTASLLLVPLNEPAVYSSGQEKKGIFPPNDFEEMSRSIYWISVSHSFPLCPIIAVTNRNKPS